MKDLALGAIGAGIFFAFSADSLPSQATKGALEPTHGTVNIILANKNGMVAVTDSRLTPVGSGQKLFKIDDHTICVVAGWFSAPGPSADNVHYPVYTAVPNMIRHMTAQRRFEASARVEDKLSEVSSWVVFIANLMLQIAPAPKEDPSASQITLGTFEQGHLRLATATITPVKVGGQWVYSETSRDVTEIRDNFAHLVKGIPTVASPILDNPELVKTNDPILAMYIDCSSRDGCRSISVEDMTLIAKVLEKKTADRDRRVGGYAQVATIVNGKAEITAPFPDHYSWDDLDIPFLNEFASSASHAAVGIVAGPHGA